MTNLTQYSRPRELGEALRLLGQEGAVAVGGGTEVNSRDHGEAIAVVDLQALGLDGIELRGPSALHIGSTVTLQSLVEHPHVPVALRDAARRELPSTLRSQATVGGTVCGRRRDSEVVAVLLLHEAVAVVLGPDGSVKLPLADLINDRIRLEHQILTAVTVDPRGVTAFGEDGANVSGSADRRGLRATPPGRRASVCDHRRRRGPARGPRWTIRAAGRARTHRGFRRLSRLSRVSARACRGSHGASP